jgi:hypothetical protein
MYSISGVYPQDNEVEGDGSHDKDRIGAGVLL